MDLAILGSGAAFSATGFNAGYLVDAGLLLDCGAPVTGLLPKMGRSVGDLETLVISHLHGDHVLNLPVLIATRLVQHPDLPPLRLIGPRGTQEHVAELGRLTFGPEFWDELVAANGPRIEEWEDGRSSRLGGYQLTAYEVAHSERLHCLAFSVESQGVSLGYSGDTTYCDGIRRLARSVQYLLCECTAWSAPAPIHLWRDEVEELMKEAPSTRFILTHLGERRPVPGALLASDGLRLTLRPGAPD
ncbi:MAG: MBL fold metallo-hydrolase [Candidatus Dormibacteria bacterium]